MEDPTHQWKLNQSYIVEASVAQFWKALDIYSKRPHIVNRRLIGAEILCMVQISNHEEVLSIRKVLTSHRNHPNIKCLLKNEFKVLDSGDNEDKLSVIVFIRKLISKNHSNECSFEIIVKDVDKVQISFINVLVENKVAPNFAYAFSFKDNIFKSWIEKGVDQSDASCQWIHDKLSQKLIKWMENLGDIKPQDITSLRLVNVTEYVILYTALKEKYGEQLVKIWPENTDPLKFVYEDIGIATYLLLLWSEQPKQRFVDLGCGNGLLVHILNSEGHLGVGYDVRARKIWTLYPPSTKLEVRTIIPSRETVFPEADWIIGNHSDELTVWIPVMAARSSYTCNFFLLPCCPYEFDGRKYCRTNTSVSQYCDFLSYLEKVCGECGIDIEKDKLRIPSTKRVCFVGSRRTYPASERTLNLDRLQTFIDSKCSFENGNCEEINNLITQFRPRSEERVRNCTQIQADVKECIVGIVVEQLLAKKKSCTGGWTYGGIVEISTLAKIIPSDLLKKLKNECGGLQTLLKNHHFIFKVNKGNVEFRVPCAKTIGESSVWKKKPCWFYHNHPNSCPLLDDTCSFIH